MAKDWAKPFYNSTPWKETRAAVLKRDRFKCQEKGCCAMATEVHHIIELSEENINNIEISLNESNLISLCSECHKRITKEEHMRVKEKMIVEYVFDECGRPVPVRTPPRGERKN